MRIEITSEDGQAYKSISNLIWEHVPAFAVLTGRNGSGKTHLLELLTHHFAGTRPIESAGLGVHVQVTGDSRSTGVVGFLPSGGKFSGGRSATISEMQMLRRQYIDEAANTHNYIYDPASMSRARHMQTILGDVRPHQISHHDVGKYFPDDFSTILTDLDVTDGLALIFVAHRLKALQAAAESPGTGGVLAVGPAPWELVNELLAGAGFPYEVIPPTESGLLDEYRLRMRDRISGLIIPPYELSSGERVLMQLVLWLFAAGRGSAFPRLVFLDEPDAHLHPSMTAEFLKVISEVLVQRYGVRVIMTTHSPSTVALAPPGSVFQMSRGEASVRPVDDRDSVIAVLTAGLITVSRATKFCLVEDAGDVNFYEAVRAVLTDYGPGRDPEALSPSPSLVFIAASVGQGVHKVAGGCSVVAKWVEKLSSPPLCDSFRGLIDRDAGNTESDRVKVLGRYSCENYLLDPLNVFGVLLENGTSPAIHGVSVTLGDEHLLRREPAGVLQAIADAISERVEAVEAGLQGQGTATVSYTTGQTIHVPTWVINHRGHDLLPIMQRAWGGHQVVNPLRLIKALRRVRLIPTELAAALASLQT